MISYTHVNYIFKSFIALDLIPAILKIEFDLAKKELKIYMNYDPWKKKEPIK